ncbi:MAG: hypothetical protein V4514_01555 [Pseudomonadota bacterium]|uniref:hypothetical protein n=1 Tax=Phenylobacterium sp. TaxID=1871053 RepID=UPI0025DFAA1C|nr:hypothetical protein [Phenylobacterium sp.]MBT9473166.1 hypothetical protein [Phenylobacterium sp.]
MTGLKTWWRKLGGLMAVCLLTTLLAAPILDAVLCEADSEAVVATSQQDHVLPSSDHPDDGHTGGSSTACPHGHCHHGVGFGVLAVETTTELSPLDQHYLAPPFTRHASRAPAGLERPPRA